MQDVYKRQEQDGVISMEELPDVTDAEGDAEEDGNAENDFTEEMEEENDVESYEISREDSDISENSEMNIQEDVYKRQIWKKAL